MIPIINLFLSIGVAIVAIYLLITWRKYSKNIKGENGQNEKELNKRLSKIEERLWILENPPLYEVGDKTPKGWLVYEVELYKSCTWVGYDWQYSLIKGHKTHSAYGTATPNDLNIKSY